MLKQFLISIFLLIDHQSIAQQFNLTSTQFKEGDVYVTESKIYFDLAKWHILPKSHKHLDNIVEFLVENDSLVIEIGYHTDSRGSDKYSMRLDLKRAQSIREYFIAQGVNAERLLAKGYGESQLLISDEEIEKMKTAQEKEEAHFMNRRTEFKIVAIVQD